MNIQIINPPSTLWDNFSDTTFPAFQKYGGEIYGLNGDLENQSEWIYVLANADGTFKNPTIDGYTNLAQIKANAGFIYNNDKLLWPKNRGLYLLSKAYSELDIFYEDAIDDTDVDSYVPLQVSFAQLAAIDLTSIPKSDFYLEVKQDGLVIKNIAAQPYTLLKDVNNIVVRDVSGNSVYAIKDF